MLHLKYVSAKSKQSRCPIFILKQKEILTFSFPGASIVFVLVFQIFLRQPKCGSPSQQHRPRAVWRLLVPQRADLSRGRAATRLPPLPPPPGPCCAPVRSACARRAGAAAKPTESCWLAKKAWWDRCETGSTSHWCSMLLPGRTVGFALYPRLLFLGHSNHKAFLASSSPIFFFFSLFPIVSFLNHLPLPHQQ